MGSENRAKENATIRMVNEAAKTCQPATRFDADSMPPLFATAMLAEGLRIGIYNCRKNSRHQVRADVRAAGRDRRRLSRPGDEPHGDVAIGQRDAEGRRDQALRSGPPGRGAGPHRARENREERHRSAGEPQFRAHQRDQQVLRRRRGHRAPGADGSWARRAGRPDRRHRFALHHLRQPGRARNGHRLYRGRIGVDHRQAVDEGARTRSRSFSAESSRRAFIRRT